MNTKLLIVLATIACAAAWEAGHQKETYVFGKFQQFLKDNNKHYATIEEYNARFEIFQANYAKLEKFTTTKSSHKVGITKFFDLTPQEFRQKYTGLHIHPEQVNQHRHVTYRSKVNAAPDTHDWREHGAVNHVKDQGQCGSCWAFSAVGNLEGQYFLQKGKALTLSEQELVACDDVDQGCNGGLMENAFDWLKQNGGEENDSDYPYTSGSGSSGSCLFSKDKAQLQVTGYEFSSTDEEQIKEDLYSKGPLAIAINASSSLMTYTGGIIDMSADECDPAALDHGVTLVGYGSENGTDYWIIKNSWAANWGEDGYFRYARGKGVCGMNTHVLSATIN